MKVPEEPDPAGVPSRPVGVWNVANQLTFLRIALVPVFGVLLLAERGESLGLRIAAFVVFVLASITDRIDGDLARSRGLVTDLGKVMDPIADKALMGMALIGLSIIEVVPWWITLVILVREVGVTLLRFAVIRHGVIPASRGGKVKTFLQAVAIAMLVLPLQGVLLAVAWLVLIAATIVTVVTGVDYVLRAVQLRMAGLAAADRERSPQ